LLGRDLLKRGALALSALLGDPTGRRELIGAECPMGWLCGVVAIADGLCWFRRCVHPHTVDACDIGSEIDGFKCILDASCGSSCSPRDKWDDRYSMGTPR
jgi:hypothetical protein